MYKIYAFREGEKEVPCTILICYVPVYNLLMVQSRREVWYCSVLIKFCMCGSEEEGKERIGVKINQTGTNL